MEAGLEGSGEGEGGVVGEGKGCVGEVLWKGAGRESERWLREVLGEGKGG